MNVHPQGKDDKDKISRQMEAEFAFARTLESQGVNCSQFMAEWRLSLHQFNVLAHFVYGVNDEELNLPPALKALLFALKAPAAANEQRAA